MLKRIAVLLVVVGACSVASAGNFRLSYGNRGQAITGYTYNYGFYQGAYGYDTSGNTYRFNYQPSFVQPVYYPVYQPYYRAPVLNDYYRQNLGGGYGMGANGW